MAALGMKKQLEEKLRSDTRFRRHRDMGRFSVPAPQEVLREAPRPNNKVSSVVTDELIPLVDVLRFSPDASLLAFASSRKREAIRIVHVPSATVYQNFPSTTGRSGFGYVTDVDFSPDGSKLACGNAHGQVLLYRLTKGDLDPVALLEFEGQRDDVVLVADAILERHHRVRVPAASLQQRHHLRARVHPRDALVHILQDGDDRGVVLARQAGEVEVEGVAGAGDLEERDDVVLGDAAALQRAAHWDPVVGRARARRGLGTPGRCSVGKTTGRATEDRSSGSSVGSAARVRGRDPPRERGNRPRGGRRRDSPHGDGPRQPGATRI